MSTPSDPTTADEWLAAIHDAFQDDSDRAAAIVSCAMLDDALKALLRRKLIAPISGKTGFLEGAHAPLATFSARIDACYQLGLISQYLARDLHLIRKIRNHFAHHALDCSFAKSPVSEWVGALSKTSNMSQNNPTAREAAGPPGPRGDFMAVASFILFSLHRDVAETTAFIEHAPEFAYVDWNQLPEEVRRLLDITERED